VASTVQLGGNTEAHEHQLVRDCSVYRAITHPSVACAPCLGDLHGVSHFIRKKDCEFDSNQGKEMHI